MPRTPVDTLIVNASELLTCKGPSTGVVGDALERLEVIPDGALALEAGRIVAVGTTAELNALYDARTSIDATGRLVSPGLVDPHSHLVFGGTRHEEYESKLTGRGPPPTLARGINYTVQRTRAASDATLRAQALADLDVMAAHGTTTLEAKTGYGLDRETELRLLRITADIEHAIEVVPTYLGAHVLPADYTDRRDAYVQLVLDTLPEAAKLAEYCDVSCDPVCFTFDECLRMADVARALGMGIRVHADQTGDASGALLAARTGARAADHLDYTTDEGFAAMAVAGTVSTLLPAVTLHMCEMIPQLRGLSLLPAEKPFMPLVARRAVAAGGVVALSTDYNPGSCFTPSMQMVMQLGARLFRLSYAAVWHMCTINAARALDRAHDRGSLQTGKRADVVIWSVPSHGLVINRFGVNLADTVIIGGETVVAAGRPVGARIRRPQRRMK
jgi:imidazolonepropionase